MKNGQWFQKLSTINLLLKEIFELLVSKSRIFDDGFQGVRIEVFMIGYRYSVKSIRHAYVPATSYDSETNLTECPYCSLSRDISKKHFRQISQPDTRLNAGFLLQSYGGRL